MVEKEKILIIGATGYIGKFLAEASAKSGHSTFALIRKSSASSPEKSKIIESFRGLGVTAIHGDLYDQESLVSAIKQVDVVISAVRSQQLDDQVNIIAAIKEAGAARIKRFVPSEFGGDVDRMHAVEPMASSLAIKARIRRAIEAEGIPYTYIVSNCFAGHFLPCLGQLHLLSNVTTPPRDKVLIPGDGNTRAIFVKEEDIAMYTIKAVADPRTQNKRLYLRPPANVLSLNELVSLWEQKIGKNLERAYISEDQLLKNIQEAPMPLNILLSIEHFIFVKGDCTNYEICPPDGVEASELYPEIKHTTVDEYLAQFV
ncbi:hypothetical protein NMG60_11007960 [Bertholletia excelsa]